ncbi:hypothetical protein QMP26_19870 [Enterocloster clostridioformis]
MILQAVFDLVAALLKLVFGWINLPDMPSAVTSVIDELFTCIQGGMGIISVFVDMSIVKILLPVLLIVVNFEHVWKFTMFILRKIPFLGIE